MEKAIQHHFKENHLVRLTDDLNLIDENQKLEDQKEDENELAAIIRWASQQYQKNQISKEQQDLMNLRKLEEYQRQDAKREKERKKLKKRQRWKRRRKLGVLERKKYLYNRAVQYRDQLIQSFSTSFKEMVLLEGKRNKKEILSRQGSCRDCLLDVQYHGKELDATIKSCIENGLQFNPYFDEGLVSKDNVKKVIEPDGQTLKIFRKLDKQISVAEDKIGLLLFCQLWKVEADKI